MKLSEITEGSVTISCVTEPEKLHNVGSKNGRTKKVFPGAIHAIRAFYDMTRGEYLTGISREEFAKVYPDKNYDKFFSEEFKVVLGHEDVKIDRKTWLGRLKYGVLINAPIVAKSEKEINPSIHTFYIKDETVEAQRMLDAFELKKKAYDLYSDMSSEEKAKVLSLYGVRVRAINPSLISSKLLSFIDKDPADFIAKKESPDLEIMSFLRYALEKGVKGLKQTKGSYWYGEIVLGPTIESACLKLKDPEFQYIVLQIKEELERNP